MLLFDNWIYTPLLGVMLQADFEINVVVIVVNGYFDVATFREIEETSVTLIISTGISEFC